MINLAFPSGTIKTIEGTFTYDQITQYIKENDLLSTHHFRLFFDGQELNSSKSIPQEVYNNQKYVAVIPLEMLKTPSGIYDHKSFSSERFSQYTLLMNAPQVQIIPSKTSFEPTNTLDVTNYESPQTSSEWSSESDSENDFSLYDDYNSSEEPTDEDECILNRLKDLYSFANTPQNPEIDDRDWFTTSTSESFCFTNQEIHAKDNQTLL